MSDSETEKPITMDELNERDRKMKEKATIPQKYQDMLQNILDQMELETGNMYQFTINTFGLYSNYNTIIGNFNRNNKIKVHNMKPGFEDLEGIYDNKSEIHKKIKLLKASEKYYDFKEHTDKCGKTSTIGKCKNCHSYNDDNPKRMPNDIDFGCCQNDQCTKRMHFSKWENLELDHYNNNIYQSSGGSISISHKIGYWQMIKN